MENFKILKDLVKFNTIKDKGDYELYRKLFIKLRIQNRV